MAKSKHYYIRKTHRWLGVILGIQFLLWTIGGLYFSWSNMDEVHGDFQKKNAPLLSSHISLVSPTVVLDTIRKVHQIDSIVSIQLIEILGKPFYQVRCISAIHNETNHEHDMQAMNHLANAETGQLRSPLTKEEAVEVAKMRFNGEPKVKSIEYLTGTNGHHEYRESPLPAYAITFEHLSKTTVIPFPVMASKPITAGSSRFNSFALAVMPVAIGCSEFCSSAAAYWSTCSCVYLSLCVGISRTISSCKINRLVCQTWFTDKEQNCL